MNISVMIDLAAAAVVLWFVVRGWQKGFVRALAELLVVVLAIVLSTQISKAAAPEVVGRFLRPATYAAIERRVDELAEESLPEESPLERLGQVIEAIPNAFVREQAQGLLAETGHSAGAALAPAREALEKAGKDVADAILDGVVTDLVRSLLCAVCFLLLTVLLRMMVRVLRLVEKLPGLRQLNELCGALAGLGKGLFLDCLGLWLLCLTGIVTPEIAAASKVLSGLSGWTGGLIG